MAKTPRLFAGAVPALPSGFIQNDLATACALVPSKTLNTYLCDLKPDWAIGLVLHGGYLAALITQAAHEFSLSQHASLNQPDLITLHLEFISACIFGPASITITVLSRGRQYSTLRLQLLQHPPGIDKTHPPTLRIEALIRQGNITREGTAAGISLPTRAPSSKWPMLDRATCIERRDAPGLLEQRPAVGKVLLLLDRETDEVGKGVSGPSIREQWIRWRDPLSRFDSIASLAYLADMYRPLIEAYGVVGKWFPTLNMSLEVKRAVPQGGWEWLFMRIEIHAVVDGRFDYDVVVLDEEGSLIALSRHACLVVGVERNYKRGGGKVGKL